MSASQTRGGVTVPFLDLQPSHEPLKEGFIEDFSELIASSAFTNGPHVASFEDAFASFCGAHHCVGLGSGLDALRLALQACEIEPGDEVIVPANTFVASAEAVTQAGGSVALVDVTEADYNLDPSAIEASINERTRFLLPVHLYGQMADMVAVQEIAARHGLTVVDDACQAHGAERDGLRAGSTGATASAFSFYPGKNLGALGDAGALVTGSAELAERVRALREHGQRAKYHHDWVGWTSRLDTVQAAALSRKLPHLEVWNESRRAAAGFYLDALAGIGDLVLPPVPTGSTPVWHLFVVRTASPADLAEFLASRGIGTGRHYPQPIHLSAAYSFLAWTEGSFPVTESLARECLSLPIYPGITEAQLQAVRNAVVEYFRRG